MKMPEKHDLLAAILARVNKGHRGNPCVCNGVPGGRYNGGKSIKTVIDATMCHTPSSFVTFSTSPGLSSNLAYITSVFIGHRTDSIGLLIKRFAAKKAGEDGRNQ